MPMLTGFDNVALQCIFCAPSSTLTAFVHALRDIKMKYKPGDLPVECLSESRRESRLAYSQKCAALHIASDSADLEA